MHKSRGILTAWHAPRDLITWLVIGFGLPWSWAAAFRIVEREVVKELVSLQGSIQDLADGRLDQNIPYLDRMRVIRSDLTRDADLTAGVRERETQGWVKRRE